MADYRGITIARTQGCVVHGCSGQHSDSGTKQVILAKKGQSMEELQKIDRTKGCKVLSGSGQHTLLRVGMMGGPQQEDARACMESACTKTW